MSEPVSESRILTIPNAISLVRLSMIPVSVAAIIIDGAIPWWIAALVLFREGAVAVTALVLAAMGARRIDVTWYGKAGTFGLMFAIPFFLTAESTIGWRDTAHVLAWV